MQPIRQTPCVQPNKRTHVHHLTVRGVLIGSNIPPAVEGSERWSQSTISVRAHSIFVLAMTPEVSAVCSLHLRMQKATRLDTEPYSSNQFQHTSGKRSEAKVFKPH